MSAGQTSCEFHPHDENILAQGGYDDLIRLWDKRNWKKPLSEIHLRGGVWRTRFNQAGNGFKTRIRLSPSLVVRTLIEFRFIATVPKVTKFWCRACTKMLQL